MNPNCPTCPICGGTSTSLGAKHSEWSGRDFTVVRCTDCRFAFVADPRTDYDQIYNDAYYSGRGVDPLVDYEHEWAAPQRTIRRHEWRAIARVVGQLTALTPETRWLDYGCGAGGLVSYLNTNRIANAEGFEEAWSERRLRERGVPVVGADTLDHAEGTYDVITAIEVLEHVLDQVPFLEQCARLLKPGGLLFVTTGNAAPYANELLTWRYLTPEIHVSLFEPSTLARAMTAAGLEPETTGFQPGWDDIIRFKLLKNLRRRNLTPLERAVPWSSLTKIVDRRMHISAHPIGRKPTQPTPS